MDEIIYPAVEITPVGSIKISECIYRLISKDGIIPHLSSWPFRPPIHFCPYLNILFMHTYLLFSSPAIFSLVFFLLRHKTKLYMSAVFFGGSNFARILLIGTSFMWFSVATRDRVSLQRMYWNMVFTKVSSKMASKVRKWFGWNGYLYVF